jgi:hypothetical protein
MSKSAACAGGLPLVKKTCSDTSWPENPHIYWNSRIFLQIPQLNGRLLQPTGAAVRLLYTALALLAFVV